MTNIDFGLIKELVLILMPSIVTLVALYFTFTQKRKDGQSDFEIDNKKNQLNYIFKPLEEILQKYDYKAKKLKKTERKDNEEKLVALRKELEPFLKLIKNRYILLVPPNLLEAFDDTNEKIHLERFIKIHNSYYNWLKRELKYPYENRKIIRVYIMDYSMALSAYDLWESLKTALLWILLYILLAIGLFFLFVFLVSTLLLFFDFPLLSQSSIFLKVIAVVIMFAPAPFLLIVSKMK